MADVNPYTQSAIRNLEKIIEDLRKDQAVVVEQTSSTRVSNWHHSIVMSVDYPAEQTVRYEIEYTFGSKRVSQLKKGFKDG